MKDEEILPWIKIISEHLGSIGSELKQIRNLLDPKAFSLPMNGSGYKTCKDESEVIPLDLEAFAAQSKDKRSDD